MISEYYATKYCSEDISLIENYDKAIADTVNVWHCHHRGEILPCGRFSPNDLKKFGLYYARPASELVFLTISEHFILHNKGIKRYLISEITRQRMSESKKGENHPNFGKHWSGMSGKRHSDETKYRISEANKGRNFSDEHRKNLSNAMKGKHFSEEHKKKLSASLKNRKVWNAGRKMTAEYKAKLSEARKGKQYWTNGIITCLAKECPGPEWKRGRIINKNKLINKGKK